MLGYIKDFDVHNLMFIKIQTRTVALSLTLDLVK